MKFRNMVLSKFNNKYQSYQSFDFVVCMIKGDLGA